MSDEESTFERASDPGEQPFDMARPNVVTIDHLFDRQRFFLSEFSKFRGECLSRFDRIDSRLGQILAQQTASQRQQAHIASMLQTLINDSERFAQQQGQAHWIPLPNLTIVHVEDNVELRNVVDRQLASAGARVLSASGADEALMLIAGERGAVQAALVDESLPHGESGTELCRRLREHCPGIRTVLTSGYPIAIDGGSQHVDQVLAKPALITAICRALLGAPHPDAIQ
jgi:CheY-like chemotaxis protein